MTPKKIKDESNLPPYHILHPAADARYETYVLAVFSDFFSFLFYVFYVLSDPTVACDIYRKDLQETSGRGRADKSKETKI